MPISLISALVLVALPLACLTAVVLIACAWRKGGVRGFVRAGSVHFGVEIDASPADDRKP